MTTIIMYKNLEREVMLLLTSKLIFLCMISEPVMATYIQANPALEITCSTGINDAGM